MNGNGNNDDDTGGKSDGGSGSNGGGSGGGDTTTAVGTDTYINKLIAAAEYAVAVAWRKCWQEWQWQWRVT